jgi:pantothenate kinase
MPHSTESPELTLCERVEALIKLNPPSTKKRIIIAMAGGPGSGKSTLSAAVERLFNYRNTEKMKVIPLVRTEVTVLTVTSTFLPSSQSNLKQNNQCFVVLLTRQQDGFHYSQSQLSTLPFSTNECPFQRRGAPFTFNSPAFIQLIQTLRQIPVTEKEIPSSGIWAPSFDHAVKDPVENDIYIPSSQRIILLEGSYLLLDEEPWRETRDVVDETCVYITNA